MVSILYILFGNDPYYAEYSDFVCHFGTARPFLHSYIFFLLKWDCHLGIPFGPHTLYCLKTDRRLVDRGHRRRMHRAMFSKICLVWEEMRNVWRGEGGLPLGCQRETRNDGFVA